MSEPTRPQGPVQTDRSPPAPPSTSAPAPARDPSGADPAPAPTWTPNDGGGGRLARPAAAPRRAAAEQGSTPSSATGWADVQRGGRGPDGGPGPDPGSQPRPVAAAPQAQDIDGGSDPWSFLHGPQAGAHLFVAGFVALLFSIGGLVAVGIRRHRW